MTFFLMTSHPVSPPQTAPLTPELHLQTLPSTTQLPSGCLNLTFSNTSAPRPSLLAVFSIIAEAPWCPMSPLESWAWLLPPLSLTPHTQSHVSLTLKESYVCFPFLHYCLGEGHHLAPQGSWLPKTPRQLLFHSPLGILQEPAIPNWSAALSHSLAYHGQALSVRALSPAALDGQLHLGPNSSSISSTALIREWRNCLFICFSFPQGPHICLSFVNVGTLNQVPQPLVENLA